MVLGVGRTGIGVWPRHGLGDFRIYHFRVILTRTWKWTSSICIVMMKKDH